MANEQLQKEIPLIWTSKGNLPMDTLALSARWEEPRVDLAALNLGIQGVVSGAMQSAAGMALSLALEVFMESLAEDPEVAAEMRERVIAHVNAGMKGTSASAYAGLIAGFLDAARPERTVFVETYKLDGEVVRESPHVFQRKGLVAQVHAQPLGTG